VEPVDRSPILARMLTPQHKIVFAMILISLWHDKISHGESTPEVTFKFVGNMATSVGYAHIHFGLPLRIMDPHLENAKEQIEKFGRIQTPDGTELYEDLSGTYEEITMSRDHLLDSFSSPDHRERRFIFATLGFAAGVIARSLFSDYSSHEMDDMRKSQVCLISFFNTAQLRVLRVL
jgi:hypothetical protein